MLFQELVIRRSNQNGIICHKGNIKLCLTLKGKYTFFRTNGDEEYEYYCTEEDACKHFLISIMKNKYYRNNYKLLDFSSLTELLIKMDLLGL